MRRGLRVALLAGLALALLAPIAWASHEPKRTNDVFQSIGIEPQTDGRDRLVNRYPFAHYQLDISERSGTDIGGQLDRLLHIAAGAVWMLASLLVMAVITLFTWAFSLDLLKEGGQALSPVADAVKAIYHDSFGRAWVVAAITLAGLWGMWKALVQRRYAETLGALGLSVIFMLIALFFINWPEKMIGRASSYTNQMSNAFLAGADAAPGGSSGDAGSAKAALADELFRAFIYQPWVVLNFGGLRHCVDGENEPVPKSGRCINHVRASGGEGGYAGYWLRYQPASEQRRAEYAALDMGKAPDEQGFGDRALNSLKDAGKSAAQAVAPIPGALLSGPSAPNPDPGQFDGRKITDADEPGVDIQQEGAGLTRLGLSLLILGGDLAVVVLLGALSLGIFLAQVLVLLLLAFAPVALVVGIFPGRGHDFFRTWLTKLGEAIVRKAVYSLILAVVLAVVSALILATSGLPWLLAFAFQSAFLWMVFFGRNAFSERLADIRSEGADRLRDAYYAKRVATGPARTAGKVAGSAAGLGVAATGVALGSRGAGRAGGALSRGRNGSAPKDVEGPRTSANGRAPHPSANGETAHAQANGSRGERGGEPRPAASKEPASGSAQETQLAGSSRSGHSALGAAAAGGAAGAAAGRIGKGERESGSQARSAKSGESGAAAERAGTRQRPAALSPVTQPQGERGPSSRARPEQVPPEPAVPEERRARPNPNREALRAERERVERPRSESAKDEPPTAEPPPARTRRKAPWRWRGEGR